MRKERNAPEVRRGSEEVAANNSADDDLSVTYSDKMANTSYEGEQPISCGSLMGGARGGQVKKSSPKRGAMRSEAGQASVSPEFGSGILQGAFQQGQINPVHPDPAASSSTLRDLGDRLLSCANVLKRCKSMPMVTSMIEQLCHEAIGVIGTATVGRPPESWVALTAWALKNLADEPESTEKRDALEPVVNQLTRFDVWDASVTPSSFSQFFAGKNVDYQGEEVKVAQMIHWEAVNGSFPKEVGALQLEDFCRLGVLHYVTHFEDYLVPPGQQLQVKPPRVMVEEAQWPLVSRGLVERGVCEVWPVSELHHIDGNPVLNGLFSVGKGEYVGLLETQRLIMNLVPTNSLCRDIRGDVATLPMVSGFNSILLEEGETILISSEDIRCFFLPLFHTPSMEEVYGLQQAHPS